MEKKLFYYCFHKLVAMSNLFGFTLSFVHYNAGF